MELIVYFDSSLAISRVLLKSILRSRLSTQFKLVLVDTTRNDYFEPTRRFINVLKKLFFLKSRYSAGMLRYPVGYEVIKTIGSDVNSFNTGKIRNALVIGCGHIFSADTISKFDNFINYHNSLLPNYKGLEVTSFELMNKESYSGVSFHQITPGVDQGQVIIQAAFPITTKMKTATEVERFKSQLASELIPSVLSFFLIETHKKLAKEINQNRNYTSKMIIKFKEDNPAWKRMREWK